MSQPMLSYVLTPENHGWLGHSDEPGLGLTRPSSRQGELSPVRPPDRIDARVAHVSAGARTRGVRLHLLTAQAVSETLTRATVPNAPSIVGLQGDHLDNSAVSDGKKGGIVSVRLVVAP